MTQLQIGATLNQNFWQALLPGLQRTAARCVLDTAETEELMLWGSTVMETPSQSISQLRKTLTLGLKESDLIMSNQKLHDGVLTAILQAGKGVRYAAVIRKPNKPAKIVIYLGRSIAC